MSDAIERLGRILQEAGARVVFDRGNNRHHPCTFCAKPAAPTHELLRIGTYPNGDPLRRPVCADCKPLVQARDAASESLEEENRRLRAALFQATGGADA